MDLLNKIKKRFPIWKQYFSQIKKEPKLVFDFFQGEFRQICYDHKIPLVRKKIIQEYLWRINETPAKDCVKNGSCLCCGCDSPAVHFCNKACSVQKYECDKAFGLTQCYPEMGKGNKINKKK